VPISLGPKARLTIPFLRCPENVRVRSWTAGTSRGILQRKRISVVRSAQQGL